MLSDDEIWTLWNSQGVDDMNQKEASSFARATEAAVLAKLLKMYEGAAPVQQEPVAYMRKDGMKAMVADEKSAWIEAGNPDIVEDYTLPLFSHPAPVQQEHEGCACRWDKDDNRVATCVRHQGWLDVVQEWADRAKEAEKRIAELEAQNKMLLEALRRALVGLAGINTKVEFEIVSAAIAAVEKQT